MRTITEPMPRPRARGRWIWSLSGLATMAVLAVAGTHLITTAGVPAGPPPRQTVVPTRTFTVTQPVTSLNVESYGAPIVVTAGPVRHVQVTEAITFYPGIGAPPAVTDSVSHGRLTLNAPDCGPCTVAFTVTVPGDVAVTAQSDSGPLTVSGVAAANLNSGGGPARVSDISGQLSVSTENGPMLVSGVADANLDSGGGPVRVTDVHGPLTVNTEGGDLTVDRLTGPLDADTGGGNLLARDIAAVTATVSTENGTADIGFTTSPELVSVDSGGGTARIGFAAAPQSVSVSTQGGDALLIVPGGPYALTAQSDGGPLSVAIATDPTARRSITADTGGGTLRIEPAAGSAAGLGAQARGKPAFTPRGPEPAQKRAQPKQALPTPQSA
jgi:hypothetical protein